MTGATKSGFAPLKLPPLPQNALTTNMQQYSSWENTVWGSLATLEYGKALRNYTNGTVPVFGTNGQIGYTHKPICNSEGIIIGRKGAYRGVHYSKVPFFVIDTAFFIKPKKTFNIKWAYYALKEYDINTLDSGSAIPSTSREDFYNIPIMIPPLAEQKAIAAVLGSLDDKIDLLHRQNTTLERMAETLFRQWFIEEAQAEWREFSVSDFVQHSKETISPQNFPSQIFYQYSIPAFDRAKSPEICLGSKILSNKFIVTENMLLISKLNPQTPRVWLITDRPPLNSVCSTEFITISPYKEENIFFLFCLFNYKPTMKTLAQVASGTSGSHQRVKPIDILSINFLSPSAEYITTFSNTASYLFKRIKSNQLQIQTLEKLRDTLLPKLMSGEVRVRVDE